MATITNLIPRHLSFRAIVKNRLRRVRASTRYDRRSRTVDERESISGVVSREFSKRHSRERNLRSFESNECAYRCACALIHPPTHTHIHAHTKSKLVSLKIILETMSTLRRSVARRRLSSRRTVPHPEILPQVAEIHWSRERRSSRLRGTQLGAPSPREREGRRKGRRDAVHLPDRDRAQT